VVLQRRDSNAIGSHGRKPVGEQVPTVILVGSTAVPRLISLTHSVGSRFASRRVLTVLLALAGDGIANVDKHLGRLSALWTAAPVRICVTRIGGCSAFTPADCIIRLIQYQCIDTLSTRGYVDREGRGPVKLREARTQKLMSVRRLARAASVAPATLYHMEHGRTTPSFRAIRDK
jgi:DNA-binding XRE family transcriptional regulator